MRSRRNKVVAVLLAISCLAVTISGCTWKDMPIRLDSVRLSNHKNVFQINDAKCSLKRARIYLCNYRNLYGSAYGMDLWQYDFQDASLEEYVKDVTLQELACIICMDLIAEKQGMKLDADEKNLVKQAAAEYYESLNQTEKSYMDVRESDVQEAYEDYALAEKLYRTLTQNIDEEVSDDEARVIRVQQIYVTDEQTAQTVSDKLAAGEDFAAVASAYNQSGKVETTIARGEYPQEVENIAFNLENGACSDMIPSDDGFYFIKCLNKLEEQLTEENKSNIRTKREKAQFEDTYQDFVDSSTFELNTALWDDVTLDDLSDITTNSFFDVYDKYFGKTEEN